MSRWVLAIAVLSACRGAVTLAIDSDRPVPRAIDSMCVGVADVSPSGGHFGRNYRLVDKLATLPQTLRIEAGGADAAWAWVRGDRGGVPAVRAGHAIDFNDDVTLNLDRCVRGAGGAPAVVGEAVGPANARLVVSHGANGQRVVALGDTASVIDVVGGQVGARDAPAPPANVVAAIAVDVDGDCDDDLVIAGGAEPPIVWLRDGKTFAPGPSIGDVPVAAVAAADVDRDGDMDLVTGAGDTLTLWLDDGKGTYTLDDSMKLSAEGRLASVTALAMGDLDGDGTPDLVAGQAGDPLRAWLGPDTGQGNYLANDGVVPAVPLAVTHLELVDVDGDFEPDLTVAVAGAPMKLYIDREGLLEDQTFSRFPDGIPGANAIAVGGWDPGCEPEVVVANDGGTQALRGGPDVFAPDGDGPPAGDVVMVDLDDDGNLDAVLATADGVRWLVR